jgi:hypothetical protein
MPADLWRQLQSATVTQLQASGGTITVCVTDRAQRNLLLALERLADTNTVTKVLVDGPLITYRLREQQPAGRSGAHAVLTSSDPEAPAA